MFISVDEIKALLKADNVVSLKYVQVAGEYRFVQVNLGAVPDHIDMIKEGEVAESAAYISTYADTLKVMWNSTSLKIGPAPDDTEKLTKLLIG